MAASQPPHGQGGASDTREEALDYLEATVGDAGPATSRARKEAFVDTVGEFIALAERHGMVFARARDYPDYYPERTGGKIGRALEVQPFDANRIGSWWDTARAASDGVAFPLKTDGPQQRRGRDRRRLTPRQTPEQARNRGRQV